MSTEQEKSPKEPTTAPAADNQWAQEMVDALNESLKEEEKRDNHSSKAVG